MSFFPLISQKFVIFILCVAVTSIYVDKNMYQNVGNCVPWVLFVE